MNLETNKETININFIGITGNIYPKKFYSTNTIRDLKLAVTQLTGLTEDFILSFGGKVLTNENKNLFDYNIYNNSHIHIISRTVGGLSLLIHLILINNYKKF